MHHAGALLLASTFSVAALADTFPPTWGTGTANEAAGPIHFAPAPWPTEPANPADCANSCGEWRPYTRFQTSLNDPRTQDPSNGGTSPQNYVNVSSSCIDKNYPSIYYYLSKGGAADGSQDVIMFRWRVEQAAHNYATGPSAGNYGATNPWNSALWTVLFDVDGDGYRDLAAHLNGSSGAPSTPIDLIAGIWSGTPGQSIDYLNDPTVKLIAHNPTAFVAGSTILNFHDSLNPDTNWADVPIASRRSWDYGTTRAKLITTNACNEYFIDYQIPTRMLDASSTGPNPSLNGPKITRNTPISMLFCTANSLNNPFQKDCAINRSYVGDVSRPGPFGDYLSFNKDQPYSQPIVSSVTAAAPGTCPGNYTFTAKVQDTLYVNSAGLIEPSVGTVKFYYWYDKDSDGTTAGDAGSSWVYAADGALKPGSTNTWTASWNGTTLPKGKYLIGVQAVDDRTLHDDGVPDAPVNNRTFSYLPGSTASATQAQIYVNPWAYDGATKTWTSGGTGAWVGTGADDQQALFPPHAPSQSPSAAENWYGNPDVTGVQTALIGVAINACGFAPTIVKSASSTSVTVGSEVTFTLAVSNPANNTGAIALTQFQDELPAGFQYKSGSTAGAFGTGEPTVVGQAVTWSGNVSIAPGASAVLSFVAIAPGVTGAYSNGASATTDFGQISSAPLQIGVGAARLTLSKVASASSTVPGSTLTYTLAYANDSPVNASGVTITDALPAGITYVLGSCTGGCAYTAATRTLSWSIGSLAAGEGTYSVSFQATLDSPYGGAATNLNTAGINSNETSPASASAAVYVASPRAQLTLQKTASTTKVDPGANVTFTLNYANTGNASATNVLLSDPLPAGFAFVSATGSPSSTPAVGANGTVTWTFTSLAAGASGSVTITAQATNPFSGAANPAVNTASIAATEVSPPVTDSALIGVTETAQVCRTYYFRKGTGNVGFDGTRQLATVLPVPQPADIGGSTLLTVPGGAGNYSGTILRFYQDPASAADTVFAGVLTTNIYLDRNPGPGITIRTTVYDYDSITGARTQIGQGTQSFTGSQTGLLTFTVPLSGTLRKEHRLLWTYEATSNNNQSTDLLFQYDGTVPNSISDTSPPIATTFADSKADFCTTPPANLVLEKSVNSSSVNVTGSGRTLTYTLSYANTSSATAATNAAIVDTLPAGVTFAGATLNGSPITPSGSNPYTFALGTVAAGGSGTLLITANVADNLAGIALLTNTAQVQSDQTALAPPAGATATTTVSGATSNPAGTPNVVLSKQASDTLLTPGDTVTYTLTAVNAGDKTATGVVVSDDFPEQAYFAYGGCSTGSGSCSQASGVLSWNIGSLSPGQAATLIYTMTVGASAPIGITTLNNSAAAIYGGGGTGSAASNTVTVSVSTNPNLAMTKTVAPAGTRAPGDTLTYALSVTNTGSGAATGVVVTDPVPANTQFAAITQGNGSFDAVNNRVIFNVGTLAGGASAALAFQVTINSPMPIGSTALNNSATVAAGNSSSRTAGAASTVEASPLMAIGKSGPANVLYPAATLANDAANATVLFVDSAAALSVGQYVRIGTTIAGITAVAGNTLTVSAPVTAAAGAAVVAGASYTLTYQNSGGADAQGVVVSDPLPGGWLFVAASPAATSAPVIGTGGTVSWNLGTLPTGSGGALQLIVIPDAPGAATNTATLTDSAFCTGATPPASCSDSVTTRVGGLRLTKVAVSPIASAGATASWTITATNSLATPIAGVELTDALPAGFTYASTGSITAVGATRTSTFDPAAGDGQPTWGTWTLPANGTLSVTFTANVDANVGPATYQNDASVISTTTGPTPIVFDPLSTAADDVTVLAAGTGIAAGIVYQDLNGNGSYDPGSDVPLPGVSVTLIDSTSTVYVAYTDASGYFSRVVAAGDTIVDIDNGTLPVSMVLTTGADGVDPSSIAVPDGGAASRNTGFVAASGTIGNVIGNVWSDADLGADKDAGEANLLGVPVVLRDAATNAVLATAYTNAAGDYSFANVPTGNYRVDVVPPAGYFVTTGNDPAAVSVAAGGTETANFGLALGHMLSGIVFKDDGAGGGTVADGLRNGAEAGTNAGGLNVVIVDGSGVVLAVASVSASGTWSALVPAGTNYRAYVTTASPVLGSTVAPSVVLPALWSVTRENVNGVVDATGDGVVSGLNATVDVSGIAFGLNTAVVAPLADVAVSISAPATAAAGSTVSLTASFANSGPASAAAVTYSLTGLPAGAVVKYNGATCSWNSGTGAVTGCGLPTSMTAGQTLTLAVTYTAPPNGVVNVTAQSSASNDSNPGNNTASASTTVTVVTTPNPVSIPTLSEWGMLILFSSLALLGLSRLRRGGARRRR
jgi:uncharacterized repeat protein (TIGR01451 family)